MGIFKPKTIHLAGKGFKKVLGEVEAEILETLWRQGLCTVRQVRDHMAVEGRDISFNAVMTIMNRLVVKGLLTKKARAHLYCYEPVQTREEFSRAVAKDILSAVLKDSTLFSAAGIVELADELDRETLKRLRQFIK